MQLEEKLKNLPNKPGVYIMKDSSGKIIYVGKAKSLKSRVKSYFRRSKHDSAKTRILVHNIRDLEYIVTSSEMEALLLENNLIKENQPKYNISLKDDKTYPYIKITKEEFPRVIVTRELKKDNSRYFGPYPSVGALNETIKLLKRLFPYRSCKQSTFNNKRPCLNYHIKTCYAPCAGKISKEEYNDLIENIVNFLKGNKSEICSKIEADMKKAAKDLNFEKAAKLRDKLSAIDKIMERQKIELKGANDQDFVGIYQKANYVSIQVFFVRGGKIVGRENHILKEELSDDESYILEKFIKRFYLDKDNLPKEIVVGHDFEDREIVEEVLKDKKKEKITIVIPQRGEKRSLLDMVTKNAKIYLETQVIDKENMALTALEELKTSLELQDAPKRMECYDISNIQGSENVASMVVFTDGKPDKKAYRRFRIKSFEGADDFRSMNEVLNRRLIEAKKGNEKFLPLPDLIIIDGGKGQLGKAKEALVSQGFGEIRICSIAKKEELLFIPEKSQAIRLEKSSFGLRIIQQIRDESHRFAITYHRSLRRKRNLESILDDIKGVGEKRKKLLLMHFGNVKNIMDASMEELLKIKGIPKDVLEEVYYFLQSQEDLKNRMRR